MAGASQSPGGVLQVTKSPLGGVSRPTPATPLVSPCRLQNGEGSASGPSLLSQESPDGKVGGCLSLPLCYLSGRKGGRPPFFHKCKPGSIKRDGASNRLPGRDHQEDPRRRSFLVIKKKIKWGKWYCVVSERDRERERWRPFLIDSSQTFLSF